MAIDPFQVATDALSDAEEKVSELARPFLRLLPVSGASVSTFGSLLNAETISATDARAERVDELQFDLGEGPCWDALSARQPVLEPDFGNRTDSSWPAFTDAVRSEGIGALFAFPLVFGPLDIGAIDLYSVDPLSLSTQQQQQTVALAAIVSRILLRNAIGHSETASESTVFSRRIIHQATGMVLAQLNTSAEDAYLIIQARAFADGRPMHAVAEDVVERRLRLTDSADEPDRANTPRPDDASNQTNSTGAIDISDATKQSRPSEGDQ